MLISDVTDKGGDVTGCDVTDKVAAAEAAAAILVHRVVQQRFQRGGVVCDITHA
jgi:hypothetical protein